jgi:hypothetical protein
MDRIIEALLDTCVKKSLGYDVKEAHKWSIVPCAKNQYLDSEYDAFEELRIRMMMHTLKIKYNLPSEAPV